MIDSCKSWQALLIILSVISGCGRKQRNIFVFHGEEESVKQSVFDFPAPRGIEVTKKKENKLITWIPLSHLNTQSKIFIGYNIYRLNAAGFIPKNPLNTKPLKQPIFLDNRQTGKQRSFYLVKAVFKINEKIVEGLSGQIKSG